MERQSAGMRQTAVIRFRPSRRSLLKWTGFGLSAAATPWLIAARNEPSRPADFEQQASTAADFVASIGVNIHANYFNTAYGNTAAWISALQRGGFAHIRTGFTTDPRLIAILEELAGRDLKIMVVCDPREHSPMAVARTLRADARYARSIWGAEGPNEVDVNGGGDWATTTRNYIITLSRLLRGHHGTAHIRIVAPSLAQTNKAALFRELGDIGAHVDYANLHPYPGGCQPSDSLQDLILSHAAIMAPGKPIVVSETGYSTQQPKGRDAPSGNPPMPADMAAILIPRIYFENFRSGVSFTDLYELLDEGDDGSWEHSLGLMSHDFRPKPAYAALSAIADLLKDPGSGHFILGGLDFRIEGRTPKTRTLLLQKRNHGFWLAIWEQREVWDGRRQAVAEASAAIIPVTLVLPAKASGAVHVPNTHGTAPVFTFSNSTRVPFGSSAAITLVAVSNPGVI